MLPYTSKFYANGTIFDSTGNIQEKYISVYNTPTDVYFLKSVTGETIKLNAATEEETSVTISVANYTLSTFSVVANSKGVYGFRGYKATPFKDEGVLYIEDDKFLVYETYDFSTRSVLLSSGSSIRDFIVDHELNYFVIHGNSKLTKFNKDRIPLYSITANVSSLSSIMTSTDTPELLSVDYVREYVNGAVRSYPIVLGRKSSSQLFLAKVDETANQLISAKTVAASGTYYSFGDPRRTNYNLTNYNFLRQKYSLEGNQVLFKLTLKNVYNSLDITTINMPVDVTQYTTGYHHFAFTIDTVYGTLNLFVDGKLLQTASIPGTDYTFQDIAYESLCVGATYFYNNIPLFKKLKQPDHYLINNCSIKQFRVYDKALTENEVRLLTFNNTKMDDLIVSLPSGQRNELDTIERIFSFNVPGNKSNSINIIIKNSDITNPVIQNQVKDVIVERLKRVLPITTTIKDIVFKNSTTTFNGRLSA